jgi:DNA-directed RNA polymerase specialized sigma subunit
MIIPIIEKQVKENIMKPKRKTNYINNKTLYGAMIHYRNEVHEAEENDTEKPIVPKYIGESILLICNNLAKKPNFSGYTYKTDMISDGIMDCIAAVDKFDPDKTNNPFAYFTQIAWNAFLRRIQKEKKQTYIKHKNFENSYLMSDIMEEMGGNQLKSNEYSSEVVRSYENKLTKTKKESKLTGVEKFSEVENEDSTDN